MTKQKKKTGGEASFLTSTAQMIGSTLGGLVAKSGLAHAEAEKTAAKSPKRAVKKTPAKKTPAKKTPAKKTPAKKVPAKKAALPVKRAGAKSRTAARSKKA